MHLLTYFAGWLPCTAEQIAEIRAAKIKGAVLFVLLAVFAISLIITIAASSIKKPWKTIILVAVCLVVVPASIIIPLIVALDTPWCN